MKNKKRRKDAICNQGKDHPCQLNVNGGYCCAEECPHMVFLQRENNIEDEKNG